MLFHKHQLLTMMKGKMFVEVTGNVGDDTMIMKDVEGYTYTFFHDQDCCESVRIADISGDISDLVGELILMAEEVIGESPSGEVVSDKTTQWTFYKFATTKGYVTVRWLGTDEGYYSKDVALKRTKGGIDC